MVDGSSSSFHDKWRYNNKVNAIVSDNQYVSQLCIKLIRQLHFKFFFLFMVTLKELFAEWKLILWKNHRDEVEGIIQHCYLAGNFVLNSALFHWLLRGHMTSNSETVFRQNLWAGKIATSMTRGHSRVTVPYYPGMLTGREIYFYKFVQEKVFLHGL